MDYLLDLFIFSLVDNLLYDLFNRDNSWYFDTSLDYLLDAVRNLHGFIVH